jgi:hypothetical protein
MGTTNYVPTPAAAAQSLRVNGNNSFALVDGSGGSYNGSYWGLNLLTQNRKILRDNNLVVDYDTNDTIKHHSRVIEQRNTGGNYDLKTVEFDILGKQNITHQSGKVNPNINDNLYSRVGLVNNQEPNFEYFGKVYDKTGTIDQSNQLISFNTHSEKLVRCFRKILVSNDKGYWDAPAGYGILDAICYRVILKTADTKYYSQKVDNSSNPPKNDVVNNNVSNDDLCVFLGNSAGTNTHVFNRLFWSSRGAGMVGLEIQFQVVLWRGNISYETVPSFGTW